MENPKLCINCKHFIIRYYYSFGRQSPLSFCKRDSPINIVTGEFLPPFKECVTERENALRLEQERCGYQGIYWEAK